MHRDQWPTIVRQPSVPATHLATVFEFWLQENGLEPPYVVAGKNFASFDLRFLRRLPNWNLKLFHRFIDPSMFYMHVGDDVPPSTDECLKRAGIQKMVEHDALADAYDVVRLVRKGILGVVC